ncbi:GNAT family N-acetyltransferase [Enterobacter sp. LM3]|uniref:GNAT family N-acetyltransferase n=1 Tax=Enterobacter sp. LM3 TaxID=3384450 RepID=UPI0039858DEA
MEISSIIADPITVRPWQESDRPFLRTLYLHARRDAWPWLNSAEWQPEDFDAATRDEEIWVAVQNGRCLGFASVWTHDNFLHNLFVDPRYQNLGVGRLLLEQAQKTFTHTGALKCLIRNERAIAFYQRHGWHVEETGDSPDGEYYLMHYRLR